MEQQYCICIVSTPESLKQALSPRIAMLFLDEILLDDETESIMEAHGYLPGLVGWTGKLFLHQSYAAADLQLTDAMKKLGIWEERLQQLLDQGTNC